MRIKTIAATAAVALTSAMGTTPAQGHFFKGCKKNKCKRHVVKPHNSHLMRIARCESDLRWRINGLFDGGLQFHPTTWNATGSKRAFAYQASPLEQKYRGVIWASKIGYAWRTTAGWPNCG